MENEAKATHPWTNRTGEAERRIAGRAERRGDMTRISLSHGVRYGVYLELANENKLLNSEIDKCLLSILEYERINKDLQKEIENYIECDEEARNMLNRKESMRGLLEQVAHKLHKTEEQIAHLR